jgi:hypothetical protein
MSSGQPFREEDWQKAQQRVLAYLRFLRLPSPENLELALKALKRAAAGPEESSEAHPVTESWRALQRLLAEEPFPDARAPGSPERKIPSLTRIPDLCGDIQSMPALNRGSMVPGKLR